MNANPKPHNGDEHDKRLNGPQTARGRLREWARARHWPELNVWPAESAMYAVLHSPGRATNTQSDGGMSSQADRYSAALAMWNRTVETAKAIEMMPREYRLVIHAMYKVEKLKRAKELDEAARVAGMPIPTYRKAMDNALAWIQGRLCLEALRGPQDIGVDGR